MTFQQWITNRGTQKLADELGVHKTTVSHWKAGRSFPQAQTLAKIKKLARGKLNTDQMLFHYSRQSKKSN